MDRVLDEMMGSDEKKLEERQVLDMVYGHGHGFGIVSSESPDFIITKPWLQQPVGVEIVRLYESETDARLERIPGYFGDLLDNQKYRHKDDQRCLDIREITILESDRDREVARVMAVIKKCPSMREWSGMIALRMTDKDEILHSARQVFAHLNLIIKDHTLRLRPVPREDICAALLTPEVVDALALVHFREVYVVTEVGDRKGFVPLRMLHLLSEAYMFDHVLHEYGLAREFDSPDLAWRAFARYLVSAHRQEVLVRSEGTATEIISGHSGLLTRPAGDVTLRMYRDHPFPPDAIAITPETSVASDTARLSALMAEARTSTRFTTSLWFSAEERPQGGASSGNERT